MATPFPSPGGAPRMPQPLLAEMAQLRVEIFYDGEVDMWGYSVPVLSIIGTGCKTRDDAERYVLDAIAFVLEEEIDEPSEGTEILSYEVQVAKAS